MIKKAQQSGFSHTKQEFVPKTNFSWTFKATGSGFFIDAAAGENMRKSLLNKYNVEIETYLKASDPISLHILNSAATSGGSGI